jgi:hypothetical protein
MFDMIETCECCGKSAGELDDKGNDVDVAWYNYDECEVTLCSVCAERLDAEEL